MNEEHTVNIVSTEKQSIKLLQLPPQNIPLYWVQESELLMVAQGSDMLPQQIALACSGIAAGALPGACTAISQLVFTGRTDTSALVALMLGVCGTVVSIVCFVVYYRHKTYPQKLLQDILARKTV